MFTSANIKSQSQVTAEKLAAAKLSAVAQINAERDTAISAGVAYDGNDYQTDETSIADLAQATQIATLNNLTTVNWLTKDNTVVNLTLAKLTALANAVFTLKTTEIYAARVKKDAVNAATTITQINTILGE